MADDNRKLGVTALAALVVSAMIGGGIFSLPQNMAQQASVTAVIIAWAVTGVGMFFIATTFRILADARPDATTGIYAYARLGFGRFAGRSRRTARSGLNRPRYSSGWAFT